MLDMVEREWQPLSPGELDQRLDQAVEEILESDLMATLKTQPPPTNTIYVQLLQSQATVGSQVLHTGSTTSSPSEEDISESQQLVETVDSAAVKVISSPQSSGALADKLCVFIKYVYRYIKEDRVILLVSRALFFLVPVE